MPCRSHFDCQGYGLCQPGTDADGTRGLFCAVEHAPTAGQFYAHCPSGTDTECDSEAGFFCVSAGAGDLDSYCTTDCTGDTQCGVGFACLPLTRPPCEDQCGLSGKPKDRSCIPSAQIGPGHAYQCSSTGVARNVCQPRRFCNACESDADCLASPEQVCAKDQSGAKICTQLCDVKHPSCPWGNAASCGLWDRDLGLATCAHRFGRCAGTGKTCEPCVLGSDCGSRGACISSSFTSEHWCVDLDVHCSCPAGASDGVCSGGGCPRSPSGLAMTCVDSTPTVASSGLCQTADSSSSVLGGSTSQQAGCWPAR